ncbi:MAG: hypothetical protein J0L58_11480 [Burkholderiales bacterium]|uniref:hypothetical protein n=1 Tax=Inhella sp. TaxID=1921806 RepID=UPI001AD01E60|nr:hypothetical protein [Burkholderiales bacterium]
MAEALMLGLGVLVGGAAVGLWARTRLQQAAARVVHLEQSRQQELQHVSAARRQVETLQKELGEARHLLARRGLSLPQRAPETLAPDAEVTQPQPLAPDGFQATQIVPRER